MASPKLGSLLRPGGVGGAGSANSRFDALGNVQPAYSMDGQPSKSALLDTKSLAFKRLVLVSLAAAYILGFHVTLGRLRVRI